jgi:hypothetical protein
MSFLKIGEKDRDGRQKRIEHTGRYLRASRTGGLSLRAQTRMSGVNLTANSRHGVRVSTRLAKGTNVALQHGRFVLRGRYGSDAARLNLSKSGLTVSSKTPVGTYNWVKPGRSSFKMAGIQVRGHKAANLHLVYFVFAALAGAVLAIFKIVAGAFQLVGQLAGRRAARRELEAHERERPRLDIAAVAAEGERITREQGLELSREPARDLFAALVFTVVCLGRGHERFDAIRAGMGDPDDAASYALAHDVRVCGQQVATWLGEGAAERAPEQVVGMMYALAIAFARTADEATRTETLLALDDACLAAGPKTFLQEEMIDLLAEALRVEVVLEGEA